MDDDDFLAERLKQADVDDPADGDVDALIGTALQRGRRRVLVRRAIGVVAVCAGLAVVAGFGITQLQDRTLGPAASPTVATPASTVSPSPTDPSSPSGSPTPTSTPSASSSPSESSSESSRPSTSRTTATPAETASESDPSSSAPETPTTTTTTRERLTQAELAAVATTLLPDGLRVTKVVGGNPYDYDHSTTNYLTVRDDAGTAYLIIGLQPNTETTPAMCSDDRCRSKQLAGGTLIYYPAGKDPDKAGADAQFSLYRPDGTIVFFSQRNSDDGNGPVTRDGLPLTDAQAEKLVTDSVWDDLAARCHPHTNNEDC